jgi:hypothetical protein
MTTTPPAHRNRLANETSPYLLQHADNPVDWYPWGEEALARAAAEDKPILLSVGYSACHWCHVMAHESFENESTAELMNRYYVNIKVDREERPDIDGVYMTAVQALTGQGGWPMTVFLTPDGRPFYAGTYFPPDDAYGRPGFPRVLQAIHEKWEGGRSEILDSAESITVHLQEAAQRSGSGVVGITRDMPDGAMKVFQSNFDAAWGGFGSAPKFPSPGNLEFLLAHHTRTRGADQAGPTPLEMVTHTLRRMATGGMYDQLGGGFARYSVDAHWLVPHFEKMLYDNAQLVRVYLHAFQVTGDAFFERVVRETLNYLEREMLSAEGGFHAAQDADSEGIEGKYFVWTVAEIDALLGSDAPLFNVCFGVTPEGNFRDPHHPELLGRNVLTRWVEANALAAQFGLGTAELEAKIAGMRARVLAARDRRVPPGLDDKVLTSWNGLALAAFAEAGRVLGDQRYREIAEQNARFVRERMWDQGRLLHTYKAGRATVEGMLEDYAYYGLGLVELYKLTGELSHLRWARDLFEAIVERFHDARGGGFFETSDRSEALLLRQKSTFDAASPSGNGSVAVLGTWMARYFGIPEWEGFTSEVVNLVHDHMLQATTGFGSTLQAIEFTLAPHRELAIIGERTARAPLEREAGRRYLPWVVIAPSAAAAGLPVFEGRTAGDGATAFVCEGMACQLPVATPEALAAQLDALD